jgi:hypothetical protein
MTGKAGSIIALKVVIDARAAVAEALIVPRPVPRLKPPHPGLHVCSLVYTERE